MKIWLVFHDHIEDSEFVSAHLTPEGAEAVVVGYHAGGSFFPWEDQWGDGHGNTVGGKRIEEVEAS